MDEVDNQVVRAWGERRMEVELVEKIDITDMKRGVLGFPSKVFHENFMNGFVVPIVNPINDSHELTSSF
ncbi:hypothetical protein KFK09_011843 [Dendrobium nobile]|uniref:Uncharacterized protein n=1 Tax=Dendrobium nobile TaxID=94219 RepID=A0A8T3BJC6_DENNO|nr:hypothetical protein KFK09_011843 [Dendrobium nobile]